MPLSPTASQLDPLDNERENLLVVNATDAAGPIGGTSITVIRATIAP